MLGVLQSRQDVVDRIRHHFLVAHVTSLARPGCHHDRRRNQYPHSIFFLKIVGRRLVSTQQKKRPQSRSRVCAQRSVPSVPSVRH